MTPTLPGLVVAGSAVVLTGGALEVTRRAVAYADTARRRNGLPMSAAHMALAQAMTVALGFAGHADIDSAADVHDEPTVTIADAAAQLGYTERHTRRLAPALGGKRTSGRWLLDQDAIDEHMRGQAAA